MVDAGQQDVAAILRIIGKLAVLGILNVGHGSSSKHADDSRIMGKFPCPDWADSQGAQTAVNNKIVPVEGSYRA